MIINLRKLLFAAGLTVCVAVFTVLAQTAGTGNITGVVSDANGAVVKGATVTVTNKETNQTQTSTTSDDGIYNFVLLKPGNYVVTTTASSFGKSTLNVEVQVGRTTPANITLTAGGVSAVVEVTAEAIQTTQANPDAVISETAIQTLPINGRRFQDFITLTPTAQVDPQRGQISLSGQKGINGNINVDGVDYNQPFFGGIRGGERSNLAFTVPQESIKEFQVVAAGYSAEFGRSTGGIVNAVTKSGDNSVRGSAFYLLRPSRLARGNEFTDALQQQNLTPRGVTATLAPTQHQYGGSIGGPIKKDKVFYFGSYEGQRFRAPRQIVFQFPTGFPPSFLTLTAAQQAVLSFYQGLQTGYTQTNDAWAGLAKIDWDVTAKHHLDVRGSISRNNALNAASRGETAVDPTTRQALSTNGTEQDRTKIIVAQLRSSFSSHVYNEGRFQYAREERPRISNSTIPQVITSFATLGAGGSDTSSFLPNREYDNRYQVAESLNWIKGNHTMKFGGEYSNIFAAQTFGFNQFGQYNAGLGATCVSATSCTTADTLRVLSNVPIAAAGTTPAFLGRFDSTSSSVFLLKQIGNLDAHLKVHELAFFAQDQWRLSTKLSINYGLRVEKQYNPPGDDTNTQVANVVKNTKFPYTGTNVDPSVIPDSPWQWGPRFGFAYDPKGNGKTVVRGFSGLYYARTPLIWIVPATQTFRSTPADVSTRYPLTGFNLASFEAFAATAAGAPYRTITGCDPAAAAGTDARARCNPNSLYRQLAIAGINLNTFNLDALPNISNAQLSTIAGALGLTPSPFVGAQVIAFAPDYKNPNSVQFGLGVEHQLTRGLVVGVDYSNVSTHHIGRFRDVNVPAPLTANQYIDFLTASNSAANVATMAAPGGVFDTIRAAGRTYIAINTPAALTFPTGAVTTRQRPTQVQAGFALGAVGIHESTGKSLYQGLTFRMRMVRKRMNLNAYYTLSRLLTDDDSERNEGVGYMDPYDLRGEYTVGRLDRKHMFMANPVFFLPLGFEFSTALRFRSSAPFNATVGADLNGDTINNDRPLLSPGVIMPRNYFRNRPIYDVDARIQKTFTFNERRKLVLSSEFFNIFNQPNLLVGSSAAPNSATSFAGAGQYCITTSQVCGLVGGPLPNPSFLRAYNDQGLLLVNSVNAGSQVFQMQLGVRFYF